MCQVQIEQDLLSAYARQNNGNILPHLESFAGMCILVHLCVCMCEKDGA